ncbi:hypothetical protein [Klebsiella pneumoniae IS10]|uniref:Uncharacterized protein n=1 Tax=Klebsiella pneumoniae TaxID=573 RepID=B6UZ44_KLEPN|nr:hypothetical protein [Klebsiella pneumoniae]CDK67351.1 hypothetical protein [Klebsiella pneumoniae IS10]CDL51298.1 hypothetical protein [Klebsiella pneumoniae ISC21]
MLLQSGSGGGLCPLEQALIRRTPISNKLRITASIIGC